MPAPTPKPWTPAPPPARTERDPQLVRNEGRLTAVVEAAYILEAVRR